MREIIYLSLMVLLLAACKSNKKIVGQPVYTAVIETVAVEEEVPDTVTPPVKPVVMKQEVVKLTHGTELMSYCIIVGSFINESFAVKLRNNLLSEGFGQTSILQNRQGMYRVSAACSDNEPQARTQLYRIRLMYNQFSDAWLLKTTD